MTFEEYWGEDPDPGKITAKHAWDAGYAEGIAQRQNHTDWLIKHIKFLEQQIREKTNDATN